MILVSILLQVIVDSLVIMLNVISSKCVLILNSACKSVCCTVKNIFNEKVISKIFCGSATDSMEITCLFS